ncbi:MAG: aminotransferase class I/II-fold pyridoxal phosphate-dependent enzyme [Coriobacteriales bacterium]|jgi:histidinol-phosphate aminotransferase|nr:aminotransferase class I/II-fold pyridoxal phosphate-dependent enzyme [Coriobacteriales bacterium]
MQRVRPSAPQLAGLAPYDPGHLPARACLNANESAYALSAAATCALAQAVCGRLLQRYPDPLARDLRARIAALHGVGEERILVGNGGDELLFDLALAYGGPGRTLLVAPPSFSSYETDARLTGTALCELPRVEAAASDDATFGGGSSTRETHCVSSENGPTGPRRGGGVVSTPTAPDAGTLATFAPDGPALAGRVSQGDIDLVMLASPNNPTGDALTERFVSDLLDASDALVLIDQAYVEFADARFDLVRLLDAHENLAILRTFSKAYALAGARLGYLLASETVIGELCKVRQPYSVDAFSALAGQAALDAQGEVDDAVSATVGERARLSRALALMPGVTVFASEANFVLFRVADAHRIWQRLYDEHGILLRDFSSAPQLTDCLRVSVGTPQENDAFLDALTGLTGGPA